MTTIPVDPFRLYLELQNYAVKNYNPTLQKIVDSMLSKRGYDIHSVIAGTFDKEFSRKTNIHSPAFSYGATFVIPFGVVLVYKDFLSVAPRDWIEFIVAHELAHICLNHLPFRIAGRILWESLPPELRQGAIFLDLFIKLLKSFSGEEPRFIVEQFIAENELQANKWAVETIGNKDGALSFLEWVKQQEITISHMSPMGNVPALKVDERIAHLKSLKI